MKAMILAAGLGTRLRPLTDDRPKALVEIRGRTLLEITLFRLRAFGIRDVIVNVHHFADMIIEYLHANRDFGMRVVISREEVLLDTGGGLKRAAYFFLNGRDSSQEPFILHNVDVISTIDFRRMVQFHEGNRALATLAVHDRQSARYLLFDEQLQLCGRRRQGDQEAELCRSAFPMRPLAFSGVHVVAPRLLNMMVDDGPFAIINTYLHLAAQGERILAFRADDYYWRDVGNADSLTRAAGEMERNAVI
jgi:mannose-1-phosphate guanylyltransferase